METYMIFYIETTAYDNEKRSRNKILGETFQYSCQYIRAKPHLKDRVLRAKYRIKKYIRIESTIQM